VQNITHLGLYGLEKATKSDRKWFARHPWREYRIRPLVVGEDFRPGERDLPPGNWTRWALIKQLAPGVRARVFCAAPLGAVPIDNDRSIAELFDDILQHPGDHSTGRDSHSGQMCMRRFLPPQALAVSR
jgi:hypothetical protein